MIVTCVNAAPGSCPLTAGRRYTVYGVGIRKLDPATYRTHSEATYLIVADNGRPGFCDASRFEVTESTFPSGWGFRYFGHIPYEDAQRATDTPEYEGAAEGMIGYPELIGNSSHYIGIELRDERDLRIFEKRRREIDAAPACAK